MDGRTDVPGDVKKKIRKINLCKKIKEKEEEDEKKDACDVWGWLPFGTGGKPSLPDKAPPDNVTTLYYIIEYKVGKKN